jgi:hypothetical protein
MLSSGGHIKAMSDALAFLLSTIPGVGVFALLFGAWYERFNRRLNQ